MDKLEPEGMRRNKPILRTDTELVLVGTTSKEEVVTYSYTGTAERKAGDTKEVRMSAPGREVQTDEDTTGMRLDLGLTPTGYVRMGQAVLENGDDSECLKQIVP